MKNEKNFCINGDLTISVDSTFEEFKQSFLFDGQVDNRFFWIKNICKITSINDNFKIGLWYKEGKIRQVQMVCVNESITNEREREKIHYKIVNQIVSNNLVDKNKIEVYWDQRDLYSNIIINYF